MAISLNSNEPNLYYLRGRWSYEVASLSWLEKKAAAAIFAAPPNASYAEALQDFTRVEELTPGVRKANLMMIAKVRRGLFVKVTNRTIASMVVCSAI